MKTCNKDAADKKGDERKAFMKECLSKKPDRLATPRRRARPRAGLVRFQRLGRRCASTPASP